MSIGRENPSFSGRWRLVEDDRVEKNEGSRLALRQVSGTIRDECVPQPRATRAGSWTRDTSAQ